ncbi:MAG: FAD-dependent oxidoreductase [Halioglobus sp.]
MSKRLVIIGAGMATSYLLQELEDLGTNLDITVIGEEREFCYNRVLLSSLLAEEATEDQLQMLSTDRAPIARFLTDTRATAIDTRQSLVHCDKGPDLAYDHLVLATGSSVARPQGIDCDLEGVMAFRNLADARQLQSVELRGQRAIVVGGGLLGLEAAHGLNRLGYETTVLHRNAWLMNRQLDQPGAEQLLRDLQASGIQFEMSASISRLNSSEGRITSVTLDSDKQLDCDVLLLASGITPNKSLAQHAGLDTDRGVLVTPNLRSSRPGIYALGECSQIGQQCFGLVAPIRRQAQVLACELMEKPGPGFAIEDWPTQLKISDIDIYRAGDLDADAEQLVLNDAANGIYRRLVIREDRLIGAVLVGDKRGGTWYSELIQSRRNIAGMRPGLMFGPDVAQALLPAVAA